MLLFCVDVPFGGDSLQRWNASFDAILRRWGCLERPFAEFWPPKEFQFRAIPRLLFEFIQGDAQIR